LRRAIKIKASVFILAWVMILSHNIIPHNHLQEENTAFPDAGFICDISPDNHSDLSIKFMVTPDDGNICQISNILFNNFNPDNLVLVSLTDYNIGIFPEINPAIINPEPLFMFNYYNGSTSLRSPPSV